MHFIVLLGSIMQTKAVDLTWRQVLLEKEEQEEGVTAKVSYLSTRVCATRCCFIFITT